MNEWQIYCTLSLTYLFSCFDLRYITDGPGSMTVFNGYEKLVDMLYTRSNTFMAGNVPRSLIGHWQIYRVDSGHATSTTFPHPTFPTPPSPPHLPHPTSPTTPPPPHLPTPLPHPPLPIFENQQCTQINNWASIRSKHDLLRAPFMQAATCCREHWHITESLKRFITYSPTTNLNYFYCTPPCKALNHLHIAGLHALMTPFTYKTKRLPGKSFAWYKIHHTPCL